MSLTGTFNPIPPNLDAVGAGKQRSRPAPFSLRLSATERVRLIEEASGTPLGSYIKAKVLGETPALHMRRTGLAIKDRKALAQLIAIFGRSRLFSNLNQLAHAVNIGTLPVTPETEAELTDALRDLPAIRGLLLVSLGLKPESAP